MSVAPHNTLKPVPAVRVLMAGVVVITPPAVSSVMRISDPTITGVDATVIVPAAVQVNVPRRVVGGVNPPVLPIKIVPPLAIPSPRVTLAAVAFSLKTMLAD